MAVTVTYTYPVSGTVPPTAFQGSQVSQVNATVNWLDADTTATITHSFALASTDPAQLFPTVVLDQHPTSTGTILAPVTVTKTSTNAVVLTKGTAAGGGGTLDVAILRPHSMVR